MITVLGSLSRRRKLFPSTAIGTSVLHVIRAIVAVVVAVVIRGNNVTCSRREEKRGDKEHDGGVGGDHVSIYICWARSMLGQQLNRSDQDRLL